MRRMSNAASEALEDIAKKLTDSEREKDAAKKRAETLSKATPIKEEPTAPPPPAAPKPSPPAKAATSGFGGFTPPAKPAVSKAPTTGFGGYVPPPKKLEA